MKARVTVVLCVVPCMFPAPAVQAQAAQHIDVFHPATLPADFEPARFDLRVRGVQVQLDALAAARPGSTLAFDLFDDVNVQGVVDRIDRRGPQRVSLHGTITDDANSWFIIVIVPDVAVGLIEMPHSRGRYKLDYLNDDVHVVRQIAIENLGRCANGPTPAKVGQSAHEDAGPAQRNATARPGQRSALGSCSSLEPVFDILIVFSDDAMNAAGGFSAMTAQCQLAIDLANQAYDNSLIDARTRLVFRNQVNYDESGDFEDHLDRVTDPDDGVIDIVHDWRNTYKADFVSFWVADDDDGTICGKAHCDVIEDEAFSVCNWSCATTNFSFAHEIGHNLGCAHDEDNCSFPCTCSAYSDSYGWRFFGISGNGWRTVMAYDNDAQDYTRINWFSNASVIYDGQPTGVVDEAENAYTIETNSSFMETFRNSGFDVWVDVDYSGIENGTFDEPYDSVGEGVQAIVNSAGASEEPTLHLLPGNSPETLVIDKHMILRACGGFVRIGE